MFIFTLKIREKIVNLTSIFFTWVETQAPTSYEMFDWMDDNQMNPYESIIPILKINLLDVLGCILVFLHVFCLCRSNFQEMNCDHFEPDFS